MTAPAHIMSDTFVNIIIDHKSYTIESTHPNFEAVKDKIRQQEWDQIVPLIDIADSLVLFTAGNVVVQDGAVFYKDKGIHNVITDKILSMMKNGYDYKPLTRFLDNLLQNPSKRAVDELYGFLETTRMPITEDGHFLAYKSVRENYTDGYTGKIDNSVGQIVHMDRNEVDDEKNRTCSVGLHFCSLEYVRDFHWGGANRHIMIVKINPADVVSIPVDYNNSKGRCWRYEVVGEHEGEVVADIFDKEVYTEKDIKEDFGYVQEGGAKAYEVEPEPEPEKYDSDEYVDAGGAKAYEHEPDSEPEFVEEDEPDECEDCIGYECFYCNLPERDAPCDCDERCECPRCTSCGDLEEDCICDDTE